MKLYAWLIGRWTMDAVVHRDDGTEHKGPGEIHFRWVLEGRAIQDVWILPGVFYALQCVDERIRHGPFLWFRGVAVRRPRRVANAWEKLLIFAHGADLACFWHRARADASRT